METSKIIYESQNHKVIKISQEDEEERGGYVSANQYLIINEDEGVLLDPGGRVMFPFILESVKEYIEPTNISYIFLSHQDPDVASSLQEWTQITPANIVVSRWWSRFVSLFGISDMGRVIEIEDSGGEITLKSGVKLNILPAHFLHSPANLSIYDINSKCLFSGDIGAAIFPYSESYDTVEDFEKHKGYMEGFHKRYMAGNKALKLWIAQIERFDVEMIAPQHGAIFMGEDTKRFLQWLGALECGVDIAEKWYL